MYFCNGLAFPVASLSGLLLEPGRFDRFLTRMKPRLVLQDFNECEHISERHIQRFQRWPGQDRTD